MSKATLQAALDDVREAVSGELASPLKAFSALVVGGSGNDVLQAESTCITVVCSRVLTELTSAERASLRRFLIQVISSPKRLVSNSPTRMSLEAEVGNVHRASSSGGGGGVFVGLISASDVYKMLLISDDQVKERQHLLVSMMQHAASRRMQIELVSALCRQLQGPELLQKPMPVHQSRKKNSKTDCSDDENSDCSDGIQCDKDDGLNHKKGTEKNKKRGSGKVRGGNSKIASKLQAIDTSCVVSFLTSVLSAPVVARGGLKLTVLSFFADIVNACWQHSLVSARKLAVTACDVWVAHGFDPNPAAVVLRSLALSGGGSSIGSGREDDEGSNTVRGGGPNSSVRCAAYNVLIASTILRGSITKDNLIPISIPPVPTGANLRVALTAQVYALIFSQLAEAHFNEPRMLTSVREKSLSCLSQMVTMCPFRDELLVIEAATSPFSLHPTKIDLSSLPPEALSFAVTLRRFVVPCCLSVIPEAILATEPSFSGTLATKQHPPTSSAASSYGSGSVSKSDNKIKSKKIKIGTQAAVAAGGNRLQGKVLGYCVALLGDPVVPTRTSDLLACFGACVGGESKTRGSASSIEQHNQNTNASSALDVLSGILQRRNPGPDALVDLASLILRSHHSTQSTTTDSIFPGDDVGESKSVAAAVAVAKASLGEEVLASSSLSPPSSSSPSDSSSPLRLLVGRLALPLIRDLTKKYLTTRGKNGRAKARHDPPDTNSVNPQATMEGLSANDIPVDVFQNDCGSSEGGFCNVYMPDSIGVLGNGDGCTNGDEKGETNTYDSSNKEDEKEALNALLFCLTSPLMLDASSLKGADSPALSYLFGGLDAALVRTCVNHLEDLLNNLPPPSTSSTAKLVPGVAVKTQLAMSGLRECDEETVLRLVELLSTLLPRCPMGTFLAARIKAAGVFSPPSHQQTFSYDESDVASSGGVEAAQSQRQQGIVLLASPKLQPALVKLALALPTDDFQSNRSSSSSSSNKLVPSSHDNSQRALFELVATFLEGCFDDRVIPLPQKSSSSSLISPEAWCESSTKATGFSGEHETIMEDDEGTQDVDKTNIHEISTCDEDENMGQQAQQLQQQQQQQQQQQKLEQQNQAKWQSNVEASVCAALSALGVVCRENATVLTKRIHNTWVSQPSLTPAALCVASVKEKEKVTRTMFDDEEDEHPKHCAGEGEEGNGSKDGAFYLNDLVRQQKRDSEVARVLEASVLGSEGFLSSYRKLIQDLAVDSMAPVFVRAAALGVVGAYCQCSPSLAREWAPRLLSSARDVANPPPLRAAALVVWSSIGPTASGQEVELCAFLRSNEAPLIQDGGSFGAIDEHVDSFNGMLSIADASDSVVLPRTGVSSSSIVFVTSPSVRVVAMRVVAKLVATERVKGNQCLCRMAETLVDNSPVVRAEAFTIFKATLKGRNEEAVTGAGLLFEVSFSDEVQPPSLRPAVAAALVKLMHSLGLEAELKGLATVVSREVTHKPHDPLPAKVLALLPPSPESLATLHQALLRGMLRSSALPVLEIVRDHFEKATEKDLQSMLSTKPKGTCNTKSQKGENGTTVPVSMNKHVGSGIEAISTDALATSKLMVQDLIRVNLNEDKHSRHRNHSHEDDHRRRQGRAGKTAQQRKTFVSATLVGDLEKTEVETGLAANTRDQQRSNSGGSFVDWAADEGSDDDDFENCHSKQKKRGVATQFDKTRSRPTKSNTNNGNIDKALQRFKRERHEKTQPEPTNKQGGGRYKR